jgi:hypothetical protein
VSQVKTFDDALGVTGLVLSKLVLLKVLDFHGKF